VKHPVEVQIGDVLLEGKDVAREGLTGRLAELALRPRRPTVFCSIFPIDGAEGSFEDLVRAVEKFRLTDASVTVERENVASLGPGLRCGFHGMLHMDVFSQRMQAEYGMDVVSTAPTTKYYVLPLQHKREDVQGGGSGAVLKEEELPDGGVMAERVEDFPDASSVVVFEPVVEATVIVPAERMGDVMAIMLDARGRQMDITTSASADSVSSAARIILKYILPYQEVLLGLVEVRGTFLVLAIGGSLAMLIPSLLLFREAGGTKQTQASRRAANASLPGLSAGQALRSTRFWRLGIGLLVISSTVGLFLLHLQPMFIDNGLTAAQAASAALMIGPTMIVGRLGTGLLFDRLPAPLVAGVAFAVMGVACMAMLGFDGSLPAAFLIAAIVGLGIGAELDVVAYMTSRYFGLRSYGVLFGGLMGVYGIGVGGGSAVAGAVFDTAGSYVPILIGLGIGSALAALMAASMGKPPVWELQTGEGQASS
jgi:hypothetical protein